VEKRFGVRPPMKGKAIRPTEAEVSDGNPYFPRRREQRMEQVKGIDPRRFSRNSHLHLTLLSSALRFIEGIDEKTSA